VVQRPLSRFIVPADRDVFHAHCEALLTRGSPQVCEVRMLRADGETFWARLEATMTRGCNGIAPLRAVVSDISERKCTEEALRTSEARYRALFESSRDALLTLSPPSWRFTSGNPAAVALFGVECEEALCALTPWQLAPERQPDGRRSDEKAREMIETAMREGTHLFDWELAARSGIRSHSTMMLSRIELEGRVVLHASVRDESASRALQVRMAQADRLSTMGLMAAGVAHEINNPLTYVVFNLQRLSGNLDKLTVDLGAADADGPMEMLLRNSGRCAEVALEGVARIRKIVQGLGTFSRIEDSELSVVSINAAIDQAAGVIQNELRFRATLIKDFGELPPIAASEGKLSQVFLNLLVNACHAIAEGDPANNRIVVRTWAEAGQLFAEVSDTGSGIPPENIERIFEPFFTTKGIGVGSGLGLAMCRTIIEQLGGRLSVESELGKGSRFQIRLPAAHNVRQKANSSSDPAAPAPHARGRVLVVDDERSIRIALGQLLGADHEIMIAGSGADAQNLLQADRRFDVILCDLMMPGVSGMDLHAWLVALDPAAASRMVFMTGGAFTPKASQFLAAAPNVRIQKPFDAETLITLVNERVDANRESRA
jgi:PAS domain S-box-containing protein